MKAILKACLIEHNVGIPVSQPFHLAVPSDAEIAAFGEDASKNLCLWYSCEVKKDGTLFVATAAFVSRDFMFVLTGASYEDGYACVGTSLSSGHVIHLLEKASEPES